MPRFSSCRNSLHLKWGHGQPLEWESKVIKIRSDLNILGPTLPSWKHTGEITSLAQTRMIGKDLTEIVETFSLEQKWPFLVSEPERWISTNSSIAKALRDHHPRLPFPGWFSWQTQNSWEAIWFLLHQIIRKIRVNSTSKICELIKTKHLSLMGYEGTRHCFWKANTLIQKSILKLKGQTQLSTGKQTIPLLSLAFCIQRYKPHSFLMSWTGLQSSHPSCLGKDAVEALSWIKRNLDLMASRATVVGSVFWMRLLRQRKLIQQWHRGTNLLLYLLTAC